MKLSVKRIKMGAKIKMSVKYEKMGAFCHFVIVFDRLFIFSGISGTFIFIYS